MLQTVIILQYRNLKSHPGILVTPATKFWMFLVIVATRSLHMTQKHIWLKNGELEIRIGVIPNYELESVILSFGKNAEVLAPELLREKLSPHHP